MPRIVSWLEALAASFGGPGLFLVAFLDSSLLSLPEINDLLVMALVVQDPDRLVHYATAATLGSLTGCLLLYTIGRSGGSALVRRRFGGPRMERALALSRRYGVLAVAVPAVLPPPAPFKIFVLLAGVARVPVWRFAVAVACGRAVRYFGEAALAARYGSDAVALMVRARGAAGDALAAHARTAAAVAAVAAVVAGGALWAVRRRRQESASRKRRGLP